MTPSQHPGVPGVEADGHLVGVGRVIDGDDHASALPLEVDAGGLAEELGVGDGRGEAVLAGVDIECRRSDAEGHVRGLDWREAELVGRHPDGRPLRFVCRSRGVDDRPLESRFVAEFLGENNVFEGSVVDASGPADETERTTVRVAGREFRLPPVGAGNVTFCVRPAAFEVGAGENRLTATVADTEFLGETTRVHLEWEGRRVVVAVEDPPDADEVTVGFDPRDAWVL